MGVNFRRRESLVGSDSIDERTVVAGQAAPPQYVVEQPVVAQPVVAQPVVAQPVVAQPVVTPTVTERRVVTHRRFDPAGVLCVAAGIALGVIGAVAMARAGLTGPLDEPVVQVVGVTHTALLGIVELAMGIVLVWAGLSRDRGAILFTTILFGAASLVAAIEPDVGGGALAIEQSWAVVLVVVFAILALVAAVAPTVWRSSDRIERF